VTGSAQLTRVIVTNVNPFIAAGIKKYTAST